MISITNNGASIQLNGDKNVTIVKRDVTKVQARGINVLVVRNTNGVERKTAIPYTSVNSPSTYPTAQALADYISSILGSIDTTSFIENSNLTYVAQVTSSPFPIPDTDLEVNGNTFVSVPSADPTPFDISVENTAGADVGLIIGSTIEIGDTEIEISGVNEGSVPAETTAAIDIEDNLGNPITPASVVKTGNTFLATLPPALDATAVLKDTAGNTLSTTNIPSGDTQNITAPDGTLNIVNTDNDPIQTETVRSGQTKSATIPNVSWTNTDGSPESTPYGDSIVCDAAPILNVDFSVNDTTPDTNQTVTFTDLTVGATQWLWDFGDGTTSSLQNPTKTYRYAGSYTVTLCATNGSISGKDIKTNYVVVTLQALISTNLQQYLACGIGASPSNMTLVSGLISQWNDESGNGYHETQGTATNRPTYNSSLLTNAVGTFGGGVFDGNDFLRNTNAAFTRVTGSFQIIFFRKKRLTVTEVYSEAGTTSTYEVFSNLNNSNLNLFNGTTSTNSIGYSLNDFMILQAHFNGASSYVQINELSRYTIANNIGTTSGVGTTSGAQFSGSNGALMDMLEKVTYSSKPSDANIVNIINRFKSKFGLW